MVLPLLIAGAGLGLSAIYNVGKAYDNERYWDAYYRRTGFRPKYSWRAGRYDSVNYLGKSLAPIGFGSRLWNAGYHPSKYSNDYGMYR